MKGAPRGFRSHIPIRHQIHLFFPTPPPDLEPIPPTLEVMAAHRELRKAYRLRLIALVMQTVFAIVKERTETRARHEAMKARLRRRLTRLGLL